jgi:paraquat-inducible protein B
MSDADSSLPEAVVAGRSFRWVWLIPVLAAVAAGWLIWSAFGQRGIPIEVAFAQGHGLKAGDAVKFRGIDVGVVDELVLSRDMARVLARIRLHPGARGVAREGSLFWIVRPQLGLTEATGLETVIGAKHVAVLPGEGPPQFRFEGREADPPEARHVPGGISLVLETVAAGGLRPGASVAFRQVSIGEITGVELAPGREGVEVTVEIPPAYRELITTSSVFWKAGGARLRAGLFRGIQLELGSLQSLWIGGISMHPGPGGAVGAPVASGHRFPLYEEPEPGWLDWEE